MNDNTSSTMKSMYGGLSDFSSLLTSALGSIDSNINNLHAANLNAVSLIEGTKVQVDSQAISLKNLEIESEQLRVKLEQTVKNLVQIENNVSSQLSDTTKTLHRELMTQRTSNKMDLHALKGNLKQSINDTIDLLAESPKASKQTTVYNANSTNEEAIKYLVEKVKYLEEMVSLQHTVNKKLSENISNNEVVTKVYEELSDEITKLDALLRESKQDNIELMASMSTLKDTQAQQLDELKATQIQQQKQIHKLLEALESTSNDHHRPRSHKKRTDSSKKRNKDIDTTTTHQEVDKTKGTTNTDIDDVDYVDLLTDDEVEEHRSKVVRSHKKQQHHQTKVQKPLQHQLNKLQKQSEQEDNYDQQSQQKNPDLTEEIRVRKEIKNNTTTIATKDNASLSNTLLTSDHLNKSDTTNTTMTVQLSNNQTTQHSPGNVQVVTNSNLLIDPENGSYDGSYDDSIADSYDHYLANSVTKEELDKGLTESKVLITTLRDEYKTKTNELEASMNAFKRVAFMMDDVKRICDTLKTRIDSISGDSETFDFNQKKTTAIMSNILKLKAYWSKVHGELWYALDMAMKEQSKKEDFDDNLDDLILNNEEDIDNNLLILASDVNKQDFITKANKLMNYIDQHIEDCFRPRESLYITLKKMQPILESMYMQVSELMLLDDLAAINAIKDEEEVVSSKISSTQSSNKGVKKRSKSIKNKTYSLSNLLCTDHSFSMRVFMSSAIEATLPILDETVSIFLLKKDFMMFDSAIKDKAEAKLVTLLDQQIQEIYKNKVDITEFHNIIGKLASNAELSKLHSYVIENIARTNYAYQGGNNYEINNNVTNNNNDNELKTSSEYEILLNRFDVLTKQSIELQQTCQSFVPRNEVHEALKAIIDEVKTLKKTCVNQHAFKESLKAKADLVEVERVIKIIATAVGELNQNGENAAAAMHVKCLICDKPVNTNTTRPRTTTGIKNSMSVSSSMPLLGYNKAMDAATSTNNNNSNNNNISSLDNLNNNEANQLFNRLTSRNDKVSKNERMKVATELTILRTSIDPLPEINDPMMDSPRTGIANANNNSHFKQRIRNSAGGGMGPNYKLDSR